MEVSGMARRRGRCGARQEAELPRGFSDSGLDYFGISPSGSS